MTRNDTDCFRQDERDLFEKVPGHLAPEYLAFIVSLIDSE